MKTKEELNALKEEVETLNKKLAELNEEELEQVTGGEEEMEQVTGGTDMYLEGIEKLKQESRQPDGSYLYVCPFTTCRQKIHGLNFQAFVNKVTEHAAMHIGRYNGT